MKTPLVCKHKHRRVLTFEPHVEKCMDCGTILSDKKAT